MRKKILSFFISLSMILAFMPTKTHAADFDLHVGNTEVTGTSASGTGWTFAFDSQANKGILTLDNATINNDFGQAIDLRWDYCDFEIKLTGQNIVSCGNINEGGVGIYASPFSPECSLKITGDGSLDVYGGGIGINADGIKNFTVEKVSSLTAEGGTYGIRGFIQNFNIINSTVTAKGGSDLGIDQIDSLNISGENTVVDITGGQHAIDPGCNSINLSNGLSIYEPLGGYISEGHIYDSSGNDVKHALIKKLPQHTIRFVNYNNTELQSSQVTHGDTPTYTDETPTKPADAQYTYTFSGWDPAITTATEDKTYTAQYSTTTNKYTIKFVNYDNNELQSGPVEYGQTPTPPTEIPTKPADAQYTYTFSGWDTEITPVTGDKTYTAKYSTTINKYTIKFVNEDGEELQSGPVEYGQTPTPPTENPTKPADEQYIYIFDKWSPDLSAVTGNATYTAQYRAIPNTHTIRFVDDDGVTLLKEVTVPHNETPSYGSEDPIKPADAQYTYTFSGWSPEIVPATEDTTYTAIYSAEANTEHSQTEGNTDDPNEIIDGEEPTEEPDNWDTPEDTPEEENLDTAETAAEEPETMEASDTPSTQESSESTDNSETSDAPRTGDETQFLLWLMLAAVSFGWLSFSAVASKKRILSLLNAIDNSGK